MFLYNSIFRASLAEPLISLLGIQIHTPFIWLGDALLWAQMTFATKSLPPQRVGLMKFRKILHQSIYLINYACVGQQRLFCSKCDRIRVSGPDRNMYTYLLTLSVHSYRVL